MNVELNDQRVELPWKVTQGDDWFQPFRIKDPDGVDRTADLEAIAQVRVERSSGAPLLVPADIVVISSGVLTGWHAIRVDRADTADIAVWGRGGDWEVEVILPGEDVARTVLGGPLRIAPQTAVRP